jgi:hypothetical protein
MRYFLWGGREGFSVHTCATQANNKGNLNVATGRVVFGLPKVHASQQEPTGKEPLTGTVRSGIGATCWQLGQRHGTNKSNLHLAMLGPHEGGGGSPHVRCSVAA